MARVRKRRKSEGRLRGGKIRLIVILLAVGLSIGVALLIAFLKNTPQNEQPSAAALDKDSSLPEKEEIEQRDRTQDKNRNSAQETNNEPETPADDTSDKHADDTEPYYVPVTTPAEDTPHHEEPKNPEKPAIEDTAKTETATETPPAKPESEPEPAPTPAPDPTTADQPPAEPTEKSEKEEPNPYKGDYTLMGGSGAVPKQWQELVGKLVEGGKVELFIRALEEKIQEAMPDLYTKKGFKHTTYRNNATLLNAVEFCYLARCVGTDKLENIFFTSGEKAAADFLRWALTDKTRPLHRLLQEFKNNGGDRTSLSHTLRILYDIRKKTDKKEFPRYTNLAIACALVHKTIATAKGALRGKDQEPLLTMPEIFAYYVERDQRHSLRIDDLKKLSISNLLYVVDPRLPRSEFDWTHSKISYTREKWGKTYSDIEYLMENAVDGTDPYKTYTFAEIKKLGGVCRDQAYYCTMTAKTEGIPATIIVGDGDRGLHAWVAYMPTDKNWTTVGSYGYNTGYFVNPCSAKEQHEDDLLRQDRKMSPDKMEIVADLMLLADYMMLCDKNQEALNTAGMVCRLYPRFITGWRNRIEIMETMHQRGQIDEKEWKSVCDELNRNMGKVTELMDIAQEIEFNHLMDKLRDISKIGELKRGYRRMQRTGTTRTSLIVESLRRQGQIYANAGNTREMANFYKQCFKDFATRGDVFEKILHQYADFLEGMNDAKLWKSIAREAEMSFGKQVYKSSDFFRTKKEADVMLYVAKLYERAGDSKKAESIRDEAKKRVEEIAQRERKNY